MTKTYTLGIRRLDVRPMTNDEAGQFRTYVAQQDSMLRTSEPFPLNVISGPGTDRHVVTGMYHAVSDGKTACGIAASDLYELRPIPFTGRNEPECAVCRVAVGR